jgi:hypothetical protein
MNGSKDTALYYEIIMIADGSAYPFIIGVGEACPEDSPHVRGGVAGSRGPAVPGNVHRYCY